VKIDPEVGAALLAGWISGAAVAFAAAALVLVWLSRNEGWRARFGRTNVRLPLVVIVVVNGMMLGWTMVGLVLGAFYLAAEGSISAGGLGTTNLLFSSLVTGAVVLVLAAGAYIRGRLTWPMWSTALVAALSLGWLLPNLAR